VVSDRFSFCPWCGRDIADRDSSPEPLKAPKGFKYHRRCQWRCGGGVMYPMQHCPWCGRPQKWRYQEFQNICPRCNKGVNDWMEACPWCGKDATGRDLIRQALRRVRQLLVVGRLKDWQYRVLLRPGVSGVTHRTPKIIEIERRYVTSKRRRRDEISWNMLTGLILHDGVPDHAVRRGAYLVRRGVSRAPDHGHPVHRSGAAEVHLQLLGLSGTTLPDGTSRAVDRVGGGGAVRRRGGRPAAGEVGGGRPGRRSAEQPGRQQGGGGDRGHGGQARSRRGM